MDILLYRAMFSICSPKLLRNIMRLIQASLKYIVATFRIYEHCKALIYKAPGISGVIFEPEGCRFESCQARHTNKNTHLMWVFLFVLMCFVRTRTYRFDNFAGAKVERAQRGPVGASDRDVASNTARRAIQLNMPTESGH